MKDESNNLVECSDAYFFWFYVFTDDNFDKVIFGYDENLIEINNKTSLIISDLYAILLRKLILECSLNILQSSSSINEFSIDVSNNILNEVNLVFYLFRPSTSETIFSQ